MATPMLELEDVHTKYGSIEALKGISLQGRGGRGRHADRLQRRRQVDHAALDLRAVAAELGLDPLPRRGDLDHPRAGHRPARDLAVAGGPALLPAHDRAREPRARRLPAPGRQHQRRPRPRLRPLPAAEGAREAEGGHDVRRRAADAGHGPRADGRARRCCCSTSPRWGSRRSSSTGSTRPSREINKQGTTILLVEQNANYALDVSSHGYVLETGKVVLADKSEALRENPEVQNAYLGT